MPKRKLDAPAVIFTDVADSEDVDGEYVKTARLLGAVMKLTVEPNQRVQLDLYSVGPNTVFSVRSCWCVEHCIELGT
jgi:hypothetical protein